MHLCRHSLTYHFIAWITMNGLTSVKDMRKCLTRTVTIAYDNGRNSNMGSYRHNRR
ncbi:unnamed protein product, partial [Haemonchus placei]|uniref:Integrase n=1 Tax=Haemonchus placei TaxID=6290 RepID=A0A0N4VYX7_HAEPC